MIPLLQAAPEGGRELDAMVWLAVDPCMVPMWPHWNAEQRESMVPHYTTSLDAAMTLVPENWTGCVDGIGSFGVIARFGPPTSDDEFTGEHSHAPLAICIAALRARGIGDHQP